MPRLKKPYVARLDEVRISRDGEAAVIDYRKPGVSGTHLTLGPQIDGMSDEEILEAHNATIRAMQRAAAEYHHIAVEVPEGSPQVRYFAEGDQWVPRGFVLRCIIDDGGPNREPIIWIDDQEFSMREFGSMLTTYAGWGMRVCFVPDDRLCEEPDIEIREPEDS